jgi:sporulation protein YlmC with PRC-barrel domain
MRRKHALITTAITLTLAAMPLAAANAADASDKIDITTWDQAKLYEGWTAEQLFDTEVRGVSKEDIGEIENIVVNADGKATKIIVEAGGVFDIGDTHFAVPWTQVQFGPNMEWVQIPVDEDNVDNFSLFDDDEVTTGPRAWKASELINDYVTLQGGERYGMVDDLVFSKEGQLEAIVVYPDVGYGVGVGRPYAYPFYGYGRGFQPGASTYELPYTMDEVSELGPFDYKVFDGTPQVFEGSPPSTGNRSSDQQG